MTSVFVDDRLRGATEILPVPDRQAVFVACPEARCVLMIDVSEPDAVVRAVIPTSPLRPYAMTWTAPFLAVWDRHAVFVYRIDIFGTFMVSATLVQQAWWESDAWCGHRVIAAASSRLLVGMSDSGFRCLKIVDNPPSVGPAIHVPYRAAPSSVLTAADRFVVLCETPGIATVLDADQEPTIISQFQAPHIEGPLAARNIGNGFVIGSESTNIVSVFVWNVGYRVDEPVVSFLVSESMENVRVRERYQVTDHAAVFVFSYARPVRGDAHVEEVIGPRHYPAHAWEASPIVDFVKVPLVCFRAHEPPSNVLLVRHGVSIALRVGASLQRSVWGVFRRKLWTWPMTRACRVKTTGVVMLHGDDGAVSWRHSIYAYTND